MQTAANDMSAAVLRYRALALIDSDKVLVSLQAGVTDAQQSVDTKTPMQILASLTEIESAMSSIDKSYQAYEKTRK